MPMRKGDRCVPKIAVYFSGYGHTAKQAEAVRAGAESVTNSTVSVHRINEVGDLPGGALEELDLADAIIYGSPTYMGGPAWQFKKFADSSAKAFFARKSTGTSIRQSSISGRYRSSTRNTPPQELCGFK